MAYGLKAQVQDTLRAEEDLEQSIEDIVTTAEIEEQVDLTFLTDYLESLREKPLNLNECTREELLQLPGMNPILVNNLLSHIARFGKLTTLYELQAVQGFDLNTIQEIRPFCSVTQSSREDISPGSKHPRGPGLREVFSSLDTEIIQRLITTLEEERGYTDPDTTITYDISPQGDTLDQILKLSSRYQGGPYRSYTRIRTRYNPYFSFALTGEKDPGEPFTWDPGNQKYGYDFLSAHISFSNFGVLKNLVIGDYTLQLGQGMVLSRGLGFGKGAETINNVKMPALGIRPYASVNENQFMRGIASTVAFGDIYLTGFYSRVRQDASVSALTDSLSETFFTESSNIQLSGLHRTESELNNRDALFEQAAGGRVALQTRTLTLGTTLLYQSFDSRINPSQNFYNQFDFRGNKNYLTGLDFDWVFQNFNFFGEVARSKSGGMGAVAGVMSSLSPTLDLALVVRRFDKDFHATKAYVFAERPTIARNESGLYLGIKMKLDPRWTITSYFDQYYFNWNKFRAGFPSNGFEYLLRVSFKPNRGTEVYTQFRSDNKEENAPTPDGGPALDFLQSTRKNLFRIHFQTNLTRDVVVRNRAEFSWYEEGEQTARGMLIYQDISWKQGFKFKVTGRYAFFDIPAFDARIYAYENDILGFFSIPPYYRKGNRYYLILNYKLTRGIEFWVRFAQTRLRNGYITDGAGNPYLPYTRRDQGLGSGLEAITGNVRSELKFQVRFKF